MVRIPARAVEQRGRQGVDEVVCGNAERRDLFEWPVPVWSGVDSARGDGEELGGEGVSQSFIAAAAAAAAIFFSTAGRLLDPVLAQGLPGVDQYHRIDHGRRLYPLQNLRCALERLRTTTQ